MEVRRYSEEADYTKMMALFQSEENWNWFLSEQRRGKHKKSLKESIVYAAYLKTELIGYLRAIEDMESLIYVCELLVNKEYRGRNTGKQLLERLPQDYPEHLIFIMSDEDSYYKKLGYPVEGSIFKQA